MKNFVIVVDTQRDFMAADGALSVAGAEGLVRPIQAWLATLDPARTAGVLFTFDTHYADTYPGSPESELFPIHCVRETAGWANMIDAGEIDPAIPVYRIEKGVFDMWAEVGLQIEDARDAAAKTVEREAFFTKLASDVTHVTVIGVAADYCVRWAIDGLVRRGFSVKVPTALTRGIDRSIEQVLRDDFAGATVNLS